jgi:hypothetical protein
VKHSVGISIGIATLLLALGYAMGGRWMGAATSVALGCLWLVGLWRGWTGMEALGLIGAVGIAAVGVWLALSTPVLLAGVVAALVAWDLDRFVQRTRNAGHVAEAAALTRAHLGWLLVVAGLGLALGAVAAGIQVPLSFGWALLLGTVAILGMSRAIRSLTRESD